jgi:hypothetical protein
MIFFRYCDGIAGAQPLAGAGKARAKGDEIAREKRISTDPTIFRKV